MTREIAILDGGNKNGTLKNCPTMGGKENPSIVGIMGEEGGYYS